MDFEHQSSSISVILGDVSDFRMGTDLDGDTRYGSVPHFMTLDGSDAGTVQVVVFWNGKGFRFHGLFVQTAVVLLTATAAATAAQLMLVRNGYVRIKDAFFEWVEDGLTYPAPPDFWPEFIEA